MRKNGIMPYLGPDGKSQVTMEYENGTPIRIDTIVISAQHLSHVSHETTGLRNPIYEQTAAYGHFGRSDLDLPWEQLDKVEVLKAELKNGGVLCD